MLVVSHKCANRIDDASAWSQQGHTEIHGHVLVYRFGHCSRLCVFWCDRFKYRKNSIGLPIMCHEIICHTFQDVLLFIVDSRRRLSAETVCGIVGQPLNCNLGTGDNLEWSINVDDNADGGTESKSEIPAAGDDDLTIVHITDTHYDPHYREGAKAVCVDPVCCRYKQVRRLGLAVVLVFPTSNIPNFAFVCA